MARKLTVFGALAVFLYVLHVLLGGWLWEGYRHLHQPISDLTAQGAPDRGILTAITLLYGICSIVFAASAYIAFKRFAPKISRTGMLVFLAMHLVSITYGLFPQDALGAPLSFTGMMHLAVTALIVPLTILAPLLVGIGLRKNTTLSYMDSIPSQQGCLSWLPAERPRSFSPKAGRISASSNGSISVRCNYGCSLVHFCFLL